MKSRTVNNFHNTDTAAVCCALHISRSKSNSSTKVIFKLLQIVVTCEKEREREKGGGGGEIFVSLAFVGTPFKSKSK